MKFALIDAEKAVFPIEFMCRQLGVSRSGYYAWRGRGASSRTKEDVTLGQDIAAIYRENRGRYGSPRVWRELKAQGRCTSRKRVARIMRSRQLVARRRRRFCRTTDSKHAFPIAPNLLERNFTAAEPNQVWVTLDPRGMAVPFSDHRSLFSLRRRLVDRRIHRYGALPARAGHGSEDETSGGRPGASLRSRQPVRQPRVPAGAC